MKIFKVTNDKSIWRGPLPKTENDFRLLKDFEFPSEYGSPGFKTILNLQSFGDTEELENLLELGWNWHLFDLDIPGYFFPKRRSIETALLILQNAELPIYIHCRHGRERTGLIVAAYRIRVEGWPVQAAYDEMVNMGCRAPHKWFYKNILKSLVRSKTVDC